MNPSNHLMMKRRQATRPEPVYTYCEPANATPYSRIHIRLVGADGTHPGGGITGSPLCGYDLKRGWDRSTVSDHARAQVAHMVSRKHNPLCEDCATLLWGEERPN